MYRSKPDGKIVLQPMDLEELVQNTKRKLKEQREPQNPKSKNERSKTSMNIIKRNGKEVKFDKSKIINAVSAANKEESEIHQLNNAQINAIADNIERQLQSVPHAVNVEEIQDLVEVAIMQMRGYEVAQKYVRYRYQKNLDRKGNSIDDAVMTLINLENEVIKQENSNKNPMIISTQRDYMAGEVSKDITKRKLLPKEIWEAHEKGIIHFHK